MTVIDTKATTSKSNINVLLGKDLADKSTATAAFNALAAEFPQADICVTLTKDTSECRVVRPYHKVISRVASIVDDILMNQ